MWVTKSTNFGIEIYLDRPLICRFGLFVRVGGTVPCEGYGGAREKSSRPCTDYVFDRLYHLVCHGFGHFVPLGC